MLMIQPDNSALENSWKGAIGRWLFLVTAAFALASGIFLAYKSIMRPAPAKPVVADRQVLILVEETYATDIKKP